jgi:hypothetical protein
MGASFNKFRNHIWGPLLGDMLNISLQEQFIQKYIAAIFNYTSETCAPIKLCALRV